MTRYYSFLRGINVGGKNSIRMDVLRQIFIDCGFSDVNTYIQSGNVAFSYKKTETSTLSKNIEAKINSVTGYNIPALIRSREQLDNIVKLDPFNGALIMPNTKLYVAFMSEIPASVIQMPVRSEKDGLELVSIIGADAFLISFEIEGRFGFPNNFIEKKLKVTASSRYWHTVLKMMESDI